MTYKIAIGTNVVTKQETYFDEFNSFGIHIIAAQTRYGKCLSGFTRVRLSEGSYVKISDLYNSFGDSQNNVLTCDLQSTKLSFNKILNISRRELECNEKMLRIWTKGNNTLCVTSNHKVFVWNEGFIEKEAKDVELGDYLISYNCSLVDNSEPLLENHEVIVLGYLLGDGSVGKNSFCFTNSNKTMLDDYIKNVKLCGFDYRRDEYKEYSTGVIVNSGLGKGANQRYYFQNKDDYNKVLQYYKKFDLILPLNSFTKHVPAIIFKTTKKQKALFLNRLFSCDGYTNPYSKQIEYSSNSIELIKGVIQLLLDFGIDSKVKEEYKYPVINGVRGKSIRTYRIFICGIENLRKFYNNINFISNDKSDNLYDILNEYICKGNSINEMLPNISCWLSELREFLKPINRDLHSMNESINLGNYIRGHRTPPRYSLIKLLEFIKKIRPKVVETESYNIINTLIESNLLFYRVENIEEVRDYKDYVYDIEVENNHNLFVGDFMPFLVHNSQLAKALAVLISEHRRILIIDYLGEHVGLKYVNFESNKYIRNIQDLKVVQNIGYLVSDFSNIYDWSGFGFAEGGAPIMLNISQNTQYHNNSIEIVKSILRDLPTNKKDLEEFMSVYPDLGIDYSVNTHTKDSLITRFSHAVQRGLFVEHNNEGGFTKYGTDEEATRIEDFGDFMMKNSKVLVNFNLLQLDAYIGRAYVSKLLEQLVPYLRKLKLAIFFEESDVLFPNVSDGDSVPSLGWCANYVLKYQKMGVELFFITQNMIRLPAFVTSNYHTLLLGALPEYEAPQEYRDIIKSLKWEHPYYREFCMIKKGKPKQVEIFAPYSAPCL